MYYMADGEWVKAQILTLSLSLPLREMFEKTSGFKVRIEDRI